MKNFTLSTISATTALLFFGLVGCSKQSSDETFTRTDPAMDSLIAQVVSRQEAIQSRRVLLDPRGTQDPNALASTVTDIAVDNCTAYATHQGGLVIYDLGAGAFQSFPTKYPLHAVAKHDGQVYLGGDRLYVLQDTDLVPTAEDFGGIVTCLFSYGPALMIGTENGLYSRTSTGTIQLMRDVWITALAADGNGLWVGTDGDGVYRWDGQSFARRFLSRDSSLFDYVNSLTYSRDRLYLGTTNGLFVYNGGRWQPYTTAEGLPSDNVMAVETIGWQVYVATDQGLVSFSDGEFKPVRHLESETTTVLRRSPNGLLVGTESDGLLLKQRDTVKLLVQTKASADLAQLASMN
jgi:hypothetical protein